MRRGTPICLIFYSLFIKALAVLFKKPFLSGLTLEAGLENAIFFVLLAVKTIGAEVKPKMCGRNGLCYRP